MFTSPLIVPAVLAAIHANTRGSTDDVIEFAIRSNEQNQAMITSGSGRAVIRFERGFPPAFAEQDPEAAEELGQGVERQEVAWYMRGEARRGDRRSLQLLPGESAIFLPIEDRRACTETEQIYMMKHPRNGWEAYMQIPDPDGFRKVRGVFATFDPMVFFRLDDFTLKGWIDWLEQGDYEIAASETIIDSRRLLVITAKHAGPPARRAEFTCDPQQRFNVTRFRFYHSRSLEPVQSVDVAYKSYDGGRVFFPDSYALHMERGANRPWEKVTVQFLDVVLNQPVDPIVFTAEGVGITKGMKVVDRRFDKPRTLYYGMMPADKLDQMVLEIRDTVAIERDVDARTLRGLPPRWVLHLLIGTVGVMLIAALSWIYIARRSRQGGLVR